MSTPAANSTLAPSASALLRIVRGAGGALLVQTGLHAELLQVEWQETKIHLMKMAAVSLLGFACLLCLMLALGAVLVAVAWATPLRYAAFAAVIAVYGAATALCWRRLQLQSAQGAASFAATRAELAADLSLLRSHL